MSSPGRDPPQPVACRLSDDTSWLDDSCLSCVPRSCVIPYKFFALADRDYFSFRPDRPLGAQLNINLAQHGEARGPWPGVVPVWTVGPTGGWMAGGRPGSERLPGVETLARGWVWSPGGRVGGLLVMGALEQVQREGPGQRRLPHLTLAAPPPARTLPASTEGVPSRAFLPMQS